MATAATATATATAAAKAFDECKLVHTNGDTLTAITSKGIQTHSIEQLFKNPVSVPPTPLPPEKKESKDPADSKTLPTPITSTSTTTTTASTPLWDTTTIPNTERKELLHLCHFQDKGFMGYVTKEQPNVLFLWDCVKHKFAGMATYKDPILGVSALDKWVFVQTDLDLHISQFALLIMNYRTVTEDTGDFLLWTPRAAVLNMSIDHRPILNYPTQAHLTSSNHSTQSHTTLALPGIQKGVVIVATLSATADVRQSKSGDHHFTGLHMTRWVAHASNLACLKLSPKSTYLATASEEGTVIRVWKDPSSIVSMSKDALDYGWTNQRAPTFEFRRGTTAAIIKGMVFSEDEKWLVVFSNRMTVHVFALVAGSGSAPGGVPTEIGATEVTTVPVPTTKPVKAEAASGESKTVIASAPADTSAPADPTQASAPPTTTTTAKTSGTPVPPAANKTSSFWFLWPVLKVFGSTWSCASHSLLDKFTTDTNEPVLVSCNAAFTEIYLIFPRLGKMQILKVSCSDQETKLSDAHPSGLISIPFCV